MCLAGGYYVGPLCCDDACCIVECSRQKQIGRRPGCEGFQTADEILLGRSCSRKDTVLAE